MGGDNIGFVRNHILSLLAYFDISKKDAAMILLAFEKVDTGYTQSVDLEAFAKYYCGKHADCFLAIWNYYKPTLTPTLKDELVSRAQLSSPQTRAGTAASTGPPQVLVPYFNLITFLLFVFPSDYGELTKVYYWLILFRTKKPVTLDLLQNLSVAFESTAVLTSTHFESLKSSRTKKIRNALTFANLQDFTVEQLQAYDERLWGVWLKPVRNMILKFQRKFLGQKFWIRMRSNMISVRSDYKGRFAILQDIIDRNYWEEGKTVTNSARDNGERKEARKKIRKYVRVLMEFNAMPTAKRILNEDDEDIEAVRNRNSMFYFLHRIWNWLTIPSMTAPIVPTGSGEPGESNKNRPRAIDDEKPIPMDIKYKSSLSVPMDDLFDQADAAILRGRAILEEELNVDEKFSDDIDAEDGEQEQENFDDEDQESQADAPKAPKSTKSIASKTQSRRSSRGNSNKSAPFMSSRMIPADNESAEMANDGLVLEDAEEKHFDDT